MTLVGIDGEYYKSIAEWKEKKPEAYNKMEKVYLSYNDWINGKLSWNSWTEEYKEKFVNYPDDVVKLHVLPESERQKIIKKQKSIIKFHIDENFAWYQNEFGIKLQKSLEKEELIKDELNQIEKLFQNEVDDNFMVWYNKGENYSLLTSKFSNVPTKGYYNEIANWYYKIIVRAEVDINSFGRPIYDNDLNHFVPQIATLYIYEYKKYLENQLSEIRNVKNNNAEIFKTAYIHVDDKEDFFKLTNEQWLKWVIQNHSIKFPEFTNEETLTNEKEFLEKTIIFFNNSPKLSNGQKRALAAHRRRLKYILSISQDTTLKTDTVKEKPKSKQPIKTIINQKSFEHLFLSGYFTKTIAYLNQKQYITIKKDKTYKWTDDDENIFIGFFWAVYKIELPDNSKILKSPLPSYSQYQKIVFKTFQIGNWSTEKFKKQQRHNLAIQMEINGFLDEILKLFPTPKVNKS